MFGWLRRWAEPPEAESYDRRLNEIDTRLERLELDSAERQVAVLNAIEKTMTQLRAREAKRAREKAAEDPSGETIDEPEVSQHLRPRVQPTDHLARRFRRW